MTLFLRIDINIIAIVLLGITLLIARKRLDKQDKLNETFLNICFIIMLEILFETLTCVINTNPNQNLIWISVFLHMCLFATAPFLSYFWYTFIYHWMVPGGFVPQKNKIALLIPVIINFIITILSPFYNFIFYIDSLNKYHRGDLFVVSAGITYFYLIFSFILIIKKRKKILQEEFVPLIAFGILPVIGGILQTLFYGILLMWSFCAFSLIIVYLFLQQRIIQLDTLSGAWTRGSFDGYISRKVRFNGSEKFGVIFVDIDGLKYINDRFGHLEGDYAIKTAIGLIKNTLRKTDIIARFGGDEFVIILDCDSKCFLEKTIDRIRLCFTQYNEQSDKDYTLGCSFGADIFNSETSIEQFLYHVDNLMYYNKNQKK
jgi:diguanylate cyclase (GGDEF)-like protein